MFHLFTVLQREGLSKFNKIYEFDCHMLGRVCLCIAIVQGPLVSFPDPSQKHFSKRGLGMREEDPPRAKHLMKNLISDPAVCKPLVLQAGPTSAREVGLACETSKQYGSIKLTEKMDFESLGPSDLHSSNSVVLFPNHSRSQF